MSLMIFLKWLHVLSAIGYIGGLVGRGVAFRRAAQTDQVHTACSLLNLSDFFDKAMVIPGSLAILITGLPLAYWLGWPILGFLQGGTVNWLLVSLVLFLGPTPITHGVLIPRRKQRARVAEAALAAGKITPALTAALNDPVVRAIRAAILLDAMVITLLMVTKPF